MWMLKNAHVKIIEKDTNSSQKKQICATVSVLLLFKLFALFSTTLPPPLPSLHTSGAQAGSCHGNKQASQQCCMSLCWEGELGGGIRVQLGMLWAQQLSNHSRPSPTPLCQLWLNTADLFWKKTEKEKKSIPPDSPAPRSLLGWATLWKLRGERVKNWSIDTW